ncbi:hypothetical protein WN944_014232 [Citrus x changshan-huyou]|uniref:DJ-1/PfpI domain-containing protein n=1 Tax=Citrus x changshan-huyou TaxID=2935761 RepID=A0AAP0MA80_9ROSI
MEAVMIIDILRRAKANVVVASVEDKPEILASRQIKLVADVLIDEAAKLSYDLIVLPGGLGGAQAFAKVKKLQLFLLCATSCQIRVKSKTGLWLMATSSPVEGQELLWSLHWQLWRSFLAATRHLSLQR